MSHKISMVEAAASLRPFNDDSVPIEYPELPTYLPHRQARLDRIEAGNYPLREVWTARRKAAAGLLGAIAAFSGVAGGISYANTEPTPEPHQPTSCRYIERQTVEQPNLAQVYIGGVVKADQSPAVHLSCSTLPSH